MSMNLYLILLNRDDVSVIEMASLPLTIALMFYQSRVQGYWKSEVAHGKSYFAFYGFLQLCLIVLITSFAVYFSLEILNPFASKYFNPYLLTVIHVFVYYSHK